MNEDISNEFDLKNKSEDCELDRAEEINVHRKIDVELEERILGIFF